MLSLASSNPQAARKVRTLKTLIVDDEPLARERVTTLLQNEEGIELLGECRDGLEAIAAVQQLQPDLVFLDVQMPGADGFQVINGVGAEKMPMVIFVTAYDQHALRAFEVRARFWPTVFN